MWLALLALLLLFWSPDAVAQSGYKVVASCSAPGQNYALGSVQTGTIDVTGVQCSSASVSGGIGTVAQGAPGASPWLVTGTVNVSNLPTGPLTATGTSLNVNITGGAGAGGTSSSFGATFPTAGTAAGAEYLSSPPTLTTGQMVALQTDVNGNLKVNIVAGGGSGGGTSSSFAAAFPATGTAAGFKNGSGNMDFALVTNNQLEVFVENSPLTVTGTGGTFPVTYSSGTFITSDTHFPAPAVLSDALSNPTVSGIGAYTLGWDATGAVWRRVQVDTGTGTLKVDASGTTQPVSGTVTLGAGAATVGKVDILGNGGAVLDASIGAGAAPTNGVAVLGQFNSTPLTLTNLQSSALQLDTNGYLEVNIKAGGGSGGGTSSSFGSAFPSTGTAAGAEYLSSPPTLTSGQMVALQTDASGNLKVNIASGGGAGGTSSNFAATFPTAGTAAGAEYLSSPPTLTTGQMVALQTDVNGNLKVNIVAGAGSGGTSSNFNATFPTSGTAAGAEYLSTPPTLTTGQMVALQTDVNGRLLISPSGLLAAQGAATSGVSGQMVMGAVTTSAPTYTTAQLDPLSLDTAGNLRVVASGAVSVSNFPATQPVSGTVFAKLQDALGNNITSTSGALNVNIASSGVTLTTSITGTVTTTVSQLPAALALSDTLSNPTTTEIGANLLLWNATNTQWQRALADNASGGLKVAIVAGAGGGTASSFGAAFPATGTAIGFKNGSGNMDFAKVDANNNLNIDCGGNPCNATDEGAYTAGATGYSNVGCFWQTTFTTGPLTTGQAGLTQCGSKYRSLSGTLYDSLGFELDNTTAHAVNAALLDSGGTSMSDTTNHALITEAFVGTAVAGTVVNIRPEVCQLTAVATSISTATNTQLVALTSGQNIRICDYEVSVNGTVNWYLESATAASCGGTLTQLNATTYFVANEKEKAMKSIYNGLNTGVGNALCINTSTTGPLSIWVSYDKS